MSIWGTVKDHRRWGELDGELSLMAPAEACPLHVEQLSHNRQLLSPLLLTVLEGLTKRETWFVCRISQLHAGDHGRMLGSQHSLPDEPQSSLQKVNGGTAVRGLLVVKAEPNTIQECFGRAALLDTHPFLPPICADPLCSQ